MYDFIGVDGVEYVGLGGLERLIDQLRPGGRLRTIREPNKLKKLLGRVCRHDAPNPHLDPNYVAAMTGLPKEEA